MLKPLPPPLRILPEPLHARLLDLGADLLPPPAQRRDLRILLEARSFVARGRRGRDQRLVHDRLTTRQDIRPGQIGRAHGHASGGRVHIRGFVHVRGGGAAEQGEHPGRGGLGAGDEAFGAEDAGCGVDAAGEGVDGGDVGGFVVPRTVFAPVGRGDFRPRVVEGAG